MKNAIVTILVLSWLPSASAHAIPIPGEGNNLEKAILLQPSSPQLVHDELPHGGARYYTLYLAENQTIRLRLGRAPSSFTSDLPPGLAVLGEGLARRGPTPDFLQLPENGSAITHPGIRTGELEYDPVAALSWSRLVDEDFTAPKAGQYYLAVYSHEAAGSYRLQVDEHPTLGLYSWWAVPRLSTSQHQWEGQSKASTWGVNLVGFLVPVLLALARWRALPALQESWGWACIGAAAFTASSLFQYTAQAILHANLGVPLARLAPTLLLGVLGGIASVILVGVAVTTQRTPTRSQRVLLACVAVLCFLAWVGFVWGSFLSAVAAFAPDDKPGPSPRKKHRP